jgi:hypothetical protein
MNERDERLRDALRGLREAPIPSCPAMRPASPEPPRSAWGLAAAAAMLGILLWTLRPSPKPEAALASRLSELEARVAAVEHEQLRTLLRRELALLRRELELASRP